ncbi:hypothetical protein PYW07_011712 [Mythimna separata]|uniref:Androgen-dependent TFPI-regulating protein-like n=1 Tax=Mythimna separata TaxID=271217 RepID=A0AAD7Y6X7_MYTSE|nr:hypothetical protein PYW07_011712 [Mythimna separata]
MKVLICIPCLLKGSTRQQTWDTHHGGHTKYGILFVKRVLVSHYKSTSMSSSIYLRLLGQAVTLGLHASNSAVMFVSMQNQELMKDVAIRNMTSLQSRYLTVWNIGFQMFYFSLAFACDFLTVVGRDNLIPKSIRRFRQTFFSAVIFPVAVLIFTIFWPLFIYDRELLFPAFIDKIFSFKSNLIMHFCILPAALWELAFLPRLVPKTHRLNLGILMVIYIVYNALILHTYNQSGLFPYPIFTMTYGTIYFPLFLIFVLFLGLGSYMAQWKLYSLVWGQEKPRNEGKVKFS